MNAIKYRMNHNPIMYNHRTRKYEVGERIFHSYSDAKANQWKCDKCDVAFSSFKELKAHKTDEHSY